MSAESTNENIADDVYYKYKCLEVSINPGVPMTNAVFTPPYAGASLSDNDDIASVLNKLARNTMLNEYEINCRNNFTNTEHDLIKKYNIKTLKDLLRCDFLSNHDKERAMKCYAYVHRRTELMDIEPFNGNTTVQFGKYLFTIRIASNKNITFIESYGKKTHQDFHLIQMVF